MKIKESKLLSFPRKRESTATSTWIPNQVGNDKNVRAFQRALLRWYETHGRDLPWRKTINPYKILVSEVMLQQTQVDRVIEKYKQFLRLFPNVQVLAHATTASVIRAWSGLGYNRFTKQTGTGGGE